MNLKTILINAEVRQQLGEIVSRIIAGAKLNRNVKENWLLVRNSADGESTEMVISGSIGKSWWDNSGTSSKEFRDELKRIPQGRKISVRINSEGGSIQDGLEIYNALKDRRQDVTAFIDGYAVSIASVIPLAASRVISPRSSIWMIHEPWSYTSGDAEDHIKSAEMLDKHGDMLASIYAAETGKSKKAMRESMKKETWLTGEEAVDFGLADEMGEEVSDEKTLAAIDPQMFRNIPQNILSRIMAARRTSDPVQGSAEEPNTNKNIMDKTKIIALLKKHGIEAKADWADEQFEEALAKLAEKPKAATTGTTSAASPATPVTATETTITTDEIVALREALATEKRARVKAMVIARGENKIANDAIDFYVDNAIRDEAATLKVIDSLPVINGGGEPVRGNVIIAHENPIAKIKKDFPKPADRYNHCVANWKELFADGVARDERILQARPEWARSLPQAANTYSATLVTNFLMDGAITNLQNRWAALMAFTRDFTTDRYKPRATGQLKNVTAGPTVQKNATNFESGDITVAPISVAVDQYSSASHVTNDELNSGLRMENLVTITTAQLANKITEVATTSITAAIFNVLPGLVSAPAAFGYSDLATLWGVLKKSAIKNILLDGEYLARIINQPTFYQMAGTQPGGGWKAFGWDYIALNTDWTGAGANVRGFACNPQAIGAISGLPLTPPEGISGNTLQEQVITIPDIGISIALYSWFALATRTAWLSYDVMFGATQADVSAGVLITSA